VKNLAVGAQFLHTDGRTDRYDKAKNRFSQSCERVKNSHIVPEFMSKGFTSGTFRDFLFCTSCSSVAEVLGLSFTK
jgi:hypothetical protein